MMLGLRARLALGMAVVASVLVIVLGINFAWRFETETWESSHAVRIGLAELAAQQVTPAVALEQPEDAAEILDSLLSHPDLVMAAVYRPDGREFARRERGHSETRALEVVRQELYTESGEAAGWVTLVFSRDSLEEIIQRNRRHFAVLGLVVVGAGLLGAWLVGGFITRPILALTRAAEAIGRAPEGQRRVDIRSGDETGILAASINDMLAALTRSESHKAELLAATQAQNRQLASFVYTVSHDLRAPLVAIGGHVSWLREELVGASPEVVESLTRVEASVVHMDRMMAELLELSRIGRVDGPVEPVDANEVVAEVLELHHPRALAAGIRLVVDGPLPTVELPRARLYQLFDNLVGNAVRHMGRPADGSPPEIRIRARAAADGWWFFVEDNGIGIPPDLHREVFKMFRTVGPRHPESTGVGLTIVQQILEQLGGEVRFDPTVSRGTRAEFRLPRRRPEGGPDAAS